MKNNGELRVEIVALEALKPHPQNYRQHYDDQLEHIVESVKRNGVYRNIVIAKDDTILAGHGVVLALKKLGRKDAPVYRLPFKSTDSRALKVLTGDNEISRLGMIDDRQLTEILREVVKSGDSLLGTGYDDKQLAALVMVSRHEGEIADLNEAAEWVGLPEYDVADALKGVGMIIRFDDEKGREEFIQKTGLTATYVGKTCSAWWPPRERADLKRYKFKAE